VVTNTIMAGISGSSLADAAATGSILIPAMKKEGYPPGYAAGIVATACLIGPVIPPSIGLIVFGALTETSIARLFWGGVVPGLIMMIVLIAVGYLVARRRHFPSLPRAPLARVARTGFSAIPAMAIPVLIMGGMRVGQFTATEASAIAVVYVLLIGTVVYRQTRPKEVADAFGASLKQSASILVIIAVASLFSTVLLMYGVGPTLKTAVTSVAHNALQFLLLVDVFIVIMGFFLDMNIALVLIGPLLAPIATSYGISLIHFGVLFLILMLIGNATPPYGLSMFLTCRIANTDIKDYAKESWPLIVGLFFIVLLLTIFPLLVTWLPDTVMGPALR